MAEGEHNTNSCQARVGVRLGKARRSGLKCCGVVCCIEVWCAVMWFGLVCCNEVWCGVL